ncbi:LuxR C-terminal-related transcriptional regulator [Actinotalea sp. K2]|uniref:helix-turn-helix transcriptional regulator n=1 Tax=Actinotalea sp. K2 TaxID=2939438 RepID=UPI0020172B2C|nr:LuxR C-terminal-related transcriptional regulator [Actinotalea sp. K2]MCL3862336.1 LuxR C-terminal-related transcriptional regulator [Actinotalea sp. K2]
MGQVRTLGDLMRLAVVGRIPLLRHGVVLQLRDRGVPVAAESATADELDGDHHAVVVVAPGTSPDPDALGDLAVGGAGVLVLTDEPDHWREALTDAIAPRRVDVLPLATSISQAATVSQVIGWLATLGAPAVAQPALTATERAVYALLASGLSNAGIARLLSLSPRTVECHVSHLFAKLDLDRADPTLNPRVTAALHWTGRAG